MISYWLLWIQNRWLLSTCACSENVFDFQWKANYFIYSGPNFFSTSWYARMSLNQYRMFVIETSTLPPSMYQKLIKCGRCSMQNNKLPTGSFIENYRKDSDNVALHFGRCFYIKVSRSSLWLQDFACFHVDNLINYWWTRVTGTIFHISKISSFTKFVRRFLISLSFF